MICFMVNGAWSGYRILDAYGHLWEVWFRKEDGHTYITAALL